jgi:hypothetical protein
MLHQLNLSLLSVHACPADSSGISGAEFWGQSTSRGDFAQVARKRHHFFRDRHQAVTQVCNGVGESAIQPN